MTAAFGTYPPTLAPMIAHVMDRLKRHQERQGEEIRGGRTSPLFVALQGPQGSGKTYLSSLLRKCLEEEPYHLKVAVLSIDDLYLSHSGLVELASRHSDNVLLSGRGQPGTHDIALGVKLLSDLRNINQDGTVSVELPFFDKSLFGGQGDRVQRSGNLVGRPLDIVILEGWCVGFYPLSPASLRQRFELFSTFVTERDPGMRDSKWITSLPFTLQHIKLINESLWDYLEWWTFFDVFLQISPPEDTPYSIVYKWRLQQEHAMKAQNGGRGLTDEQVETFVDRYIPGYVFFLDGIQDGYVDSGDTAEIRPKAPNWKGNGLRITIDEVRSCVGSSGF